jgi:hypothetical protein
MSIQTPSPAAPDEEGRRSFRRTSGSFSANRKRAELG